MIYSMTGFGQATGTYNGKTIKVEIKSLNGKTTDLRLRLANNYKEKEIEIRNLVLEGAKRGKIEASVSVDSESGDEVYEVNQSLFKEYSNQLKSLANETGLSNENIIPSILRIPGILIPKEVTLSDEEWAVVKQIIEDGIANLNAFRSTEGLAMQDDFDKNLEGIRKSLSKIEAIEASRISQIRERIRKNLQQFIQEENVDQNRYEQEILYYLEKLDINEEKMRLGQHCSYFESVMNEEGLAKGKKMSFISQEIGREINTMGAKAQEHNMQQLVVQMKDDLEKIKEMIANVL